MAPNSQYGSAETVEVLGIVQSPGVLQELSHVDYDQPINKPFSVFPSLRCGQDVLISYSLAPVSCYWQHCYKAGARSPDECRGGRQTPVVHIVSACTLRLTERWVAPRGVYLKKACTACPATLISRKVPYQGTH